jgi:hypothetical protein
MNARNAALYLLLLMALPLAAQEDFSEPDISFDDSPFSSRLLPDVGLGERPPQPAPGVAEEAAAPTRKLKVFVNPLVLDTEGARVSRITAGVASQDLAVPFRLSLNYGSIEPDGLESLSSYGVSLSSKVLEKVIAVEGLGLSLLGSYSDTRGGSHQTRAGVSGEIKFGASPFSLGGDVVWARKASSKIGSVDAVIPVAKVFYEQELFSVGVDYTFKNKVDGDEDDFSVELNLPIRGTLVAVGGGKNETVYLYLFRNF